MKKIYGIYSHTYEKQKVAPYNSFYKTELEAIEHITKVNYIDDDEVILILPVYITEKRYKWIFDEM